MAYAPVSDPGPPPRGASPQGGSPAAAKDSSKHPPHDSFREFIETIVFVVVLVLILKTFLAEAFVIPTGSMATTLLGYHSQVTCPKCGYKSLINKSKEADPAEGRNRTEVTGFICENCSHYNPLRLPFPQGGQP